MFFETALVYPRGGWYEEPNPDELTKEDVWLTTSDHVRLHAWWCPCANLLARGESAADRPVVLLFHGNGGELSMRAGLANRLQVFLGADVFLIDYRGYGKSGGSPHEAGLYLDSRAAWKYLTETRGVPPGNIILYGESIGTAVALELAVAMGNRHRALIMQSPFTSLPDAAAAFYPWLPVHLIMCNRFPSKNRIKDQTRPLFVVHGENDSIVPTGSRPHKLFELGVSEGEAPTVLRGRGHNDLTLDDRMFKKCNDLSSSNKT